MQRALSPLLRRLVRAESLTPEERDAKVNELVSFVRYAAANHLDTPVSSWNLKAGRGRASAARLGGWARRSIFSTVVAEMDRRAWPREFPQIVMLIACLPRPRRWTLRFA